MTDSSLGFVPLTENLYKIEKFLWKDKGIKETPKTGFCVRMDFIMTIFCEGCKTRMDIVGRLVKNFQPIHLWEVVERVSTCDCCEECSRKFGKKKSGSCKCACFELYEVFTMALEKEAYDRLAKIEGRPLWDEIMAVYKLRKVSKN